MDNCQNTNDLATKKQIDFIKFLFGVLHFKKKISLFDLENAFCGIKDAKQKWFSDALLKKEASSIISYLVNMGDVPEKGTKEWDLLCKPVMLSMHDCIEWDDQNFEKLSNNLAFIIIQSKVANAYYEMAHREKQLSDCREYGCH
jgi:hypothetical protein